MQIQTLIALTILLCTALFMMFMQLYTDSIEDYPAECGELIDFGFKVFPYWSNVSWLADVWVIVSIVIFVVFTLAISSELALRRFMLILACLFFCRALIVPTTRYPGLPINANRYRPDNWLAGAILVLIGVHQTATDMLFSGHTANWILTASMMSRYSNYQWYAVVFWIFNICGIVSLIFLREHYLSDIITGVIVSKLAFWAYHLFLDSEYMRYWVPGVYLISYTGEPVTINGERVQTTVQGKTTVGYTRLYWWLRWLDNE
jgi:PAP2 superfamily C-terminal